MVLDPELTKEWLDIDHFKKKYQKVPVQEYPNNVLKAIPEPKVSVLLITYQHVNYIREAIDSVLIQETDFPFEIIIGDDESTDGTREICVEYAEKHPDKIRLFLHKRENNISVLGKPTGIFQIAYNTLNCNGQYIATAGGDDYWVDSNKLQKQVDYLEAHTGVSFTYHDHVRFFTESEETKGPYSVERIQTVMGRNIFDKLPDEFLRVMQEDTFFKFFWKQVGRACYIKDIDPSVVRFHPKSMYTSLQDELVYAQRINLWKNIIKACKDGISFREEANKKLFEVIFYKYRNRGVWYLLKNLSPFLSEINKHDLKNDLLKTLPNLVLNKVYSSE